jgi:hypothetical protein
MADTSMIERELVVPDIESGGSAFSWSAAIAGAFAATAVTFVIVALGSGIGLSLAWPRGPSGTALTVGAAVWLVMAQTFGFATGGYLAARLRSPANDGLIDETTFRDAAQGLMVWAISVVAMAVLAGSLALWSAGATVQAAAAAVGAGSGGRSDVASGNSGATPTDYFVDLMFRPRPGEAAAGGSSPGAARSDNQTVGAGGSPGAKPALDAESRAEATRVIAHGITQNGLDDNDRAYLALVVSARTGLPRDESERRVAEVEGKAREAVKQAAETAAKVGAMFSFWTFMSLLFGGAAATLAGILGGQLRDADSRMAVETD